MTDWRWQGPERRAYTRREWVSATAASVLITPLAETAAARRRRSRASSPASAPLPLTEFQPKSMLHVRETRVQRARFPVIDFHTHVSRRRAQKPGVPPAELVKTMDAVNLHTMVNLTGGTGEDLAGAIAGLRPGVSPPVRVDDRADVDPGERDRLRGLAGRRDRQGQGGGRGGREGPQDARTLPARRRTVRQAGARGRCPVRSDVGGVRPAGPAGGDPRRRSGGVLPADRSLQRALRGAQRAPRLVVPRQGLPGVQGDPRRARSRVRAAPEDHVRRAARRPLGGEPGRGRRDAGQVPQRPRRDRRAHRRARPAAAHRGAGSSIATRTASCSAPTPSRSASKRRSRCSAKTCTGSTTASSRPRTSTSTTRRRRCRRRADGGSTASGCRNRSCARSTPRTPSACSA